MSKSLNILAPTRYPWTFNGPRFSAHHIDRRDFLPLNKIPHGKLSTMLDGMTVFNPWPPKRFDLVHAFNRIPMGGFTPYIVGFESHLPRMYGMEDSSFFARVSRSLAQDRCKGLFPFSKVAHKRFVQQNSHFPWFDALEAKLQMRYPNLVVPDAPDRFSADLKNDPVKIVFVGSHFARKGGCACLRMAQMAQEAGFPLELHIVSSLYNEAWTDPTRGDFFDQYLSLIEDLPNVEHHGALSNEAVMDLLGGAHYLMLPTFSDTFGFSVLEAMSLHTPSIVTPQGALGEFLMDGENGFVLPLDLNEFGEWQHLDYGGRHTECYEKVFAEETERLAEEGYRRIVRMYAQPEAYMALRKNAYETVKAKFCARTASAYWDGVYERVCC